MNTRPMGMSHVVDSSMKSVQLLFAFLMIVGVPFFVMHARSADRAAVLVCTAGSNNRNISDSVSFRDTNDSSGPMVYDSPSENNDSLDQSTLIYSPSLDSSQGQTNNPYRDTIDTAGTVADTAYRVWNEPFFSLGIGWEFGEMTPFELWNSSFPDSVLVPIETPDTTFTKSYSLVVKENPGNYYIAFPLSFVFTPYVTSTRNLALYSTFFWMRKHFNAVARTDIDTFNVSWKIHKRLSLISLSIGALYYHSINPEFFRINNVEQTFFIIGVSGSPLLRMYNGTETEFNSMYQEDGFSTYGLGIDWRCGIASRRRFTDHLGLEIGVLYNGQFNGRFMNNGNHVVKADLSGNLSSDIEALKYVSHRFSLYMNILFRSVIRSHE